MATAYEYTIDGYYYGQIEDYGLLPNNATYTAPELREGFIPRWTGESWEQVENHMGEQGWLNDQPYTIAQYGPYPAGYLTQAEYEAKQLAEYNSESARFGRLRQERDARIAATDYLMTSDYPLTDTQRAAVTAYRTALRDLPAQDGAPWDGGGEATPWPEMPELR